MVNALLLIGKDVPDVHHVLEQRIGPDTVRFAHRLLLGCVIIRNVCFGDIQTPSTYASVNKPTVLSSGRQKVVEPSERHLAVQMQFFSEDRLAQYVFARIVHDAKEGFSVEVSANYGQEISEYS